MKSWIYNFITVEKCLQIFLYLFSFFPTGCLKVEEKRLLVAKLKKNNFSKKEIVDTTMVRFYFILSGLKLNKLIWNYVNFKVWNPDS